MKIAFIVDTFPTRSETFILNQICGLIDLGVDVTVLAVQQGDFSCINKAIADKYQLKNRVQLLVKPNAFSSWKRFTRIFNFILALKNNGLAPVESLSAKFGYQGRSLLLASALAAHSKTLKFDIILCHFGHNGLLAMKLRELGILSGKIATFFHGQDISRHQVLARFKIEYQRLFEQTELMLPISDFWEKKLQVMQCPLAKIAVHRMGVDTKAFAYSTSDNTKKGDFTLFTVARFCEKKGLEYAIEALALLPQEISFHYILAGFGELECQLRELVKQRNLMGKVSFVGSLTADEVSTYMSNSDVFIQPSVVAQNGDMEGIPVSIMEAMARGTLVISTYHSGIPELVEDGVNGYLVEERNAKMLAKAIEQAYYNPDSNTKLLQHAREKIEAIANIDTLNQRLLKMLQQLANA